MWFSRIVYVVLVYVNAIVIASLMFGTDQFVLSSWLDSPVAWLTWLVAVVLVALLVVADAVRNALHNQARPLLRSMTWFKFVLIPYFVVSLVFFGTILLGLGLTGAFFTLGDIASEDSNIQLGGLFLGAFSTVTVGAAAAIAAVASYAVLLPTSADGIAFLVILRRRRQIGIAAFLAHLVLHLMFVADLVSTVILLVTYWKKVVSGRDSAAVGAVEATA